MVDRYLDHDWYPEPLPSNVQLGTGTWLYSSYAFLHYQSDRGVVFGRANGIYEHTMFVLGHNGHVTVGDYGTFNGSLLATNSAIHIGDHAMLGYRTTISDSGCPLPPEARLPQPETDQTTDEVVIGDNVWINSFTVVLGGITIGDDAVIATGTVIDESVPAGAIVAGQPARTIGSVYDHE